MSSYVKIIYDKLDFLEFRQNILFLKLPQHKADIFLEMTVEDFIKIRDFTKEFEEKFNLEEYNLNYYENKIKDLWSISTSFPMSYSLIAKSLMKKENYNLLMK